MRPSYAVRSRDISLREIAVVAVCAIATSIVMTWPLASRITEIFPGMGRIGDPYLHSWQIAWQAHALETDVTEYFHANTQWPHTNTLAFLDTTIGYAPAGFVGDGLAAAVARYNVLFLFAYSLAAFGSYHLARQLGCGAAGAAVAAAAFAFAPWRVAQNGHLLVLSSGGIPLALFFLLRGYVERRGALVVVGGVVAAWQLSVGFTLGLQFTHLLVVLVAIFFVRVLIHKERDLSARFVAAMAASAGIFIVAAILLAIPFLSVAAEYPEATNRISEVELYSPPPSAFLVPSEHNLLWGEAAEGLRHRLEWPEEQTLFPGITIVVLAMLGVFSPVVARRVRIGLALGVIGVAILSMGLSWGPSRTIYSFLYDVAPGWRGVRTPGRLNTSTSLGLALLAGFGAQLVVRWLNNVGDPGFRPRARRRARGYVLTKRVGVIAVSVALTAAVLVEGKGSIWTAASLERPPAVDAAQPPVLHLPFDEISDRIYTFWSIEGFPETVNGVGAIVPRELKELRLRMQRFPSEDTVATLRDMGVNTVVLHRDLAVSTPWQNAAAVPIEGLGITRTDLGDVMLFDLDPN